MSGETFSAGKALLLGLTLLAVLPGAQAQRARLAQQVITDPASGRDYELLLSQPRDSAPAGGYPALFVLDGNHTAPLALAWLRDHDRADRVLVVGIGYPDTKDFNVPRRFADLTPTAVPTRPGSGRSAAFFDFIENEIKPRVAGRYPLDRTRTALFGHSLGGLAVLSRLIGDAGSFSAYFAASPSLWWDDDALVARLARYADACRVNAAKTVVITVGRDEQPTDLASEPDPERRARLERRRMVDHAQQAAATLAGCENLDVPHRVFEDAGHLAALERGLDFALSQWLDDAPPTRGTQ